MNLLIIFTDQQHKYALGKRNTLYKTPHLDTLADDGVLFRNAYSNNPLCGPFRGCLMTGLLTSHNGLNVNNMPLPADTPALARQLRDHGWQTGFVGKWHLGGRGTEPIPENIRGGFEHFKGYQMFNGFDPQQPYCNRVAFYDEDDVEHLYQEHRTEVTTKLAREMLLQMAQSPQPFCMVVGYQAPHYPEQPLPAYEAMYQATEFPLTDEEAATEPYTPTFNPRSPADRSLCPDFQRYGGNMAEYKRLYAAMVSQVDHGVGELIAALRSCGKYDDTMIVFTSDHGDMQGSHGMVNKDNPYEMSAGVPMIIRMPGGRQHCISDHLISGIDIYASAMALAAITNDRDGQNFLPYVSGQTDAPFNECIISESLHGQNPWQMIRTDRHKLVVSWPEHQPQALFDMLTDPDERINLLDHSEDNLPLIRQMMDRLINATT